MYTCAYIHHAWKHAQGSLSHHRGVFSIDISTGTSKPSLLQPICRSAGCLLSSHVSASPCICKTCSFGAEMQRGSSTPEKMLRPRRQHGPRSIRRGSRLCRHCRPPAHKRARERTRPSTQQSLPSAQICPSAPLRWKQIKPETAEVKVLVLPLISTQGWGSGLILPFLCRLLPLSLESGVAVACCGLQR